MDVSGSVLANLDAGHPCRHDERCLFILVCERKLMDHFVVRLPFCAISLCFLNSEDPVVLIDDRVEIGADGGGTEENEIFLE
jgi:hypothetical protein